MTSAACAPAAPARRCSSRCKVEAYGGEVPITQVGTIGVPEPRMLTVQVWDRSLVGAVERAIRDSGLGLNPLATARSCACRSRC